MQHHFGERLKSARKMSGMSLQELADRMDKPVSRQAINKYEQGRMLPESGILLSLASALEVKPDYFFRQALSLQSIEFRKHNALPEKEKARIKAKSSDILERYLELESFLGIDSSFINPFKGVRVSSPDQIDELADGLRDAWRLGFDPLPDVVEMLESYNVKVVMLNTHDAFDGLSAWSGSIPLVVFNKGRDIVRRRFTVLHELAHLLLDFQAGSEKDNEKLAHSFAGAVLFPKESFIRAFGGKRTHFTQRELIEMKEYYGISVQAIMVRAKILGVIPDSTYRNFCITWSAFRVSEPGEYKSKEEPARFRQLLDRALSEEVITMSKAAELAGKSYEEMSMDITFV
ncbi:MAG: ImmA/IrrE family metallo-endopeptidase [Chlorobiaceae bacterium]|nr:ImmA/IrrE family metallo-endopeptidase [Chlorobiaceae bacterium]